MVWSLYPVERSKPLPSFKNNRPRDKPRSGPSGGYDATYLVGGQVELIEAGVGGGQPVRRPVVPVDLELLRTVHTLQRTKTLKSHLLLTRVRRYGLFFPHVVPILVATWSF